MSFVSKVPLMPDNSYCSKPATHTSQGFTLVEVIVVAVIVAILAAVAIPLYTGYVRDSRVKVADNIAGSVASACGGIKAFDPAEIPDGAFGSGSVITVPGTNAADSKIISIPDGFTVAINKNAFTVVCSYDNDPSIKSKIFSF